MALQYNDKTCWELDGTRESKSLKRPDRVEDTRRVNRDVRRLDHFSWLLAVSCAISSKLGISWNTGETPGFFKLKREKASSIAA